MTHTQADENITKKDCVFTFAGGLLLKTDLRVPTSTNMFKLVLGLSIR